MVTGRVMGVVILLSRKASGWENNALPQKSARCPHTWGVSCVHVERARLHVNLHPETTLAYISQNKAEAFGRLEGPIEEKKPFFSSVFPSPLEVSRALFHLGSLSSSTIIILLF